MTIPTSERLAQALHAHGLFNMEAKARDGFYDDYKSPLATPIVQLVRDLQAQGQHDLAKRAMNGEFDASREEAEDWAKKNLV
jgi:hypothetical protein